MITFMYDGDNGDT